MKTTTVLLISICAGCAASSSSPQNVPNGVPNFHQVDSSLYRGGQPTEAGFKALASLGVKTVIDLREDGEHSQDQERNWVESAGMKYVSVPMKGMSAPPDGAIAKILGIVNDASEGPVFVHCRRGADRTGTVVACYRISHDHWNNRAALDEARGFGMRFFEFSMENFVLRYSSPTALPAAAIPASN